VNFIYICSEQEILADQTEKINQVFYDSELMVQDEKSYLYIDKRNKKDCFVETDDYFGYVLGYIRDYRLGTASDVQEHNKASLNAIKNKEWPLERHTGSFSVMTYNKKNKEIVLANDILGIYPVYYYKENGLTVISSSLILISAVTGSNLDFVGVTERLIRPENCNFGKRTITKNVYRLLPGELISINKNQTQVSEKKYDNSFYRDVSKPELKGLAESTLELIEKEFAICLLNKDDIGLALSGGLDSRILLAAIDKRKNILGLTYGDEEFYETEIAKDCATATGIKFEAHTMYKHSFPDLDLMQEYTLKTEAIGVQPWISLHEETKGLPLDSVYLIGDICDGLTGKNILTYKSRASKVKNFFKYMLFNREFPFTRNTPEEFIIWQEKIISQVVSAANNIDYKNFDISKEKIIEGIIEDLNVLFERIKQNNVPYIELLDEVFGWYTHGRIPMAKQLLLSKKKYFPLAPILSMQLFRHSSNIHPSIRINFGLVDKIFKLNKLKALASIPTAQIPWIPYKYPSLLKFFVWGIRSTLDQALIKRQLRKKDVNLRHRVLNTVNWILPYRESKAKENCESWFKKDYINKKEYCVKTLVGRSEMELWPLLTADIITYSGLNIEIDLIKKLQEE